jgi:KTSC domain
MSMPELTPVDSTNVAAVGYDAEEQEIYVEFGDGGIYKYSGPDQQTFEELLEAPSVGSFLNRAIKPNYPYTRL